MTGFANPLQPNIPDFIVFIRNVMGITTSNLPDSSFVIPMAFSVAMTIVNPALAAASYMPGAAGSVPVSIYVLAVYNLGGDNIINFAPDPASPPGDQGYFSNLRESLNIGAFVSGVIQSSADESTSNTMVVQEAAKNFTLANLQQLKTPYGRQYLAFAQSYGPTIVGIS